MRLRHQYLVAGLAWAVLLAPGAGLSLFAFALGVSWLWLFGDDPWPEAAQWALPLIGIIGGLAVAAVCIVVAVSYGRWRETVPGAPTRSEQRVVIALVAAPLLIIALWGANAWREAEDYNQARTTAAQRQAAFDALAAASHRIDGLTVAQNDGAFHAAARLVGERDGEYRLAWQVVDTSFGTAVTDGERVMRLQKGSQQVAVVYRLDELALGYQEKLSYAARVLVEESFHLEVAVEPLLDAAERAALPPGEMQRLDLGQSPLRSHASTSFPVRFVIRRDGSIEQ